MTGGACHSIVSTCAGVVLLAGTTMQTLTIVVVGAVLACSASAQFFQPFVPSSPGLGLGLPLHPAAPQIETKRAYVHPAVQRNSEAEAQLPPSLQNPFYKNPAIAASLAKASWFTPGEEQVREREAEKIPRQKIYSILKNAGLARRRR